jgi:pimeloyl-ACP methyl ester carboxylesterase
MPHVALNGIDLFYDVSGSGPPIVFSHEFASDYRGWDPQVRAFGRLYQCVTYCHRGFPPSSVPTDPAAYSQELLIADLLGLVDHLGFPTAHFVGFSMGGNIVLNFALRYPERCQSIVVVGTGSGTVGRERFLSDIDRTVSLLRSRPMTEFADVYARGPTRLPFLRKDPHGWQVFRDQLTEHAAEGQALLMTEVLAQRKTIFELRPELEVLRVPTLLIVGDEDAPCVEPGVFMRQHIPGAGLLVVPQTGHAVNLEEPALFNAAVLEFLRLVEAGRWYTRTAPMPGPTLLPEDYER